MSDDKAIGVTNTATERGACAVLLYTSRRTVPQQIRMVEHMIQTIKEQCIHCQRFDSILYATRAVGDWISFYKHRRAHQALDMTTPAEVFALAS